MVGIYDYLDPSHRPDRQRALKLACSLHRPSLTMMPVVADRSRVLRNLRTLFKPVGRLVITMSARFTDITPSPAETTVHHLQANTHALGARRKQHREWRREEQQHIRHRLRSHNSTITHAVIPNPNHVHGREIPRYAAVRPASCVTSGEAMDLPERLRSLKKPRLATPVHSN